MNSNNNNNSKNSSSNRNSNNSNSNKSNGGGSHQLEQQQQQQQPDDQQPAFNPFELQGLNDLLAASGQFDMNNPLAGFMAAALAAQGQAAGGAFGAGTSAAAAFNPFLMPPFGAPLPPGAAASSTAAPIQPSN